MTQADRLRGRKRPVSIYHLLVEEDDTAARAAVSSASEALELAQLRADDGAPQAVKDAQKALDKAQRALDACYEPIPIRALSPKAFEALVAEHPSKDKDQAWAETFPRALFLACVEGDLTEQEWNAFLDDQCSQGERLALHQEALNVNARWPSGAIPKG